MKKFDVIIIGAGASGIFASIWASKNNRSVAVLEMTSQPLRKVNISGGGRCNFTNTNIDTKCYFGENTNFVHSALSQFSPTDMLKWAKSHHIKTTQKNIGQYFCANGATELVKALLSDSRNTKIFLNQTVISVSKEFDTFTIKTDSDLFCAKSVIISTGGLSYPNLGVSDIGFKIAKQFGHKIVPVRPALCAIETTYFPSELCGISVPVCITINKEKIYDDMMITHFGIGGLAIYSASVHNLSNGIHINMLPETNIKDILLAEKQINGRYSLSTLLCKHLPIRVAKWISKNINKNIADLNKSELEQIYKLVSDIYIPYNEIKLKTFHTAEAMRGGISTQQISSKTMESKLCPGLFFTGEVMDITGNLGGFNLQWAWSSGFVAGNNA